MTHAQTHRGATAPFDPTDPVHHAAPAGPASVARAKCPVAEVRDRVFVISRFDDVRDVLLDTERFSNFGNFQLERDAQPPGGVELITQLDPPAHTQLRAHLLKKFAPKELRKHEARVGEIVDGVLAPFVPGATVDAFADVARPVTSRTVYAFLGFPEKDWERVKVWGDAVNDILPEPFDSVPEFQDLIAYLMTLAAERKAGAPTGQDVLDTLLHDAPEGGQPLGAEEAAVHAFQLVLAGTDTTAALISNLLYQLLRDRRHWMRLLDDRSLIPVAIEESLRLDSPLQMIMRTVRSPGQVHGCPVGDGDKLLVSLQSANWDESVWGDDAAEFSLDRDRPGGHLAMGRGIHACLGAPLARLQARVVLNELLERFPGMRIADGYEYRVTPLLLGRWPASLPVVLER
jgi:cytochrome P450